MENGAEEFVIGDLYDLNTLIKAAVGIEGCTPGSRGYTDYKPLQVTV